MPVCAYVGKTSDDFSTNELAFLAKNFNFIVVEKGQAMQTRGSTEAGIAEAARQIKQRNPKAMVLFYWNSFLDVAQYKAHSSVPNDGHLKDLGGKPVMVRKPHARH